MAPHLHQVEDFKMNNHMAPDIDPLSTYNLNNYPNLENFGNSIIPFGNTYPYSVKVEDYANPNFYNPPPQAVPPKCAQDVVNESSSLNNSIADTTNGGYPPDQTQITETDHNNEITNNQDNTEEEDIKPDISLSALSKKIKKERSKYFSEKITEKDFKFYGCSVCNINFKELQELDNHVIIHKDRITSYDLRIKNQIKKKKMRKELKKSKKLKKNVKAEPEMEIEIKPEDGYIGNEKATDFVNNTESDNQSSKENNGEKSKNIETKTTDGNALSQISNKQELMNLQKIYKCFACQKQFTLSYYLKLHVRSHTDEKPYTCAQCGQTFITASKLGRHNKRFHLAIRYQCRICYKYFS
ncbi:jg871, partial [Pararge aegeria aegeria]